MSKKIIQKRSRHNHKKKKQFNNRHEIESSSFVKFQEYGLSPKLHVLWERERKKAEFSYKNKIKKRIGVLKGNGEQVNHQTQVKIWNSKSTVNFTKFTNSVNTVN